MMSVRLWGRHRSSLFCDGGPDGPFQRRRRLPRKDPHLCRRRWLGSVRGEFLELLTERVTIAWPELRYFKLLYCLFEVYLDIKKLSWDHFNLLRTGSSQTWQIPFDRFRVRRDHRVADQQDNHPQVVYVVLFCFIFKFNAFSFPRKGSNTRPGIGRRRKKRFAFFTKTTLWSRIDLLQIVRYFRIEVEDVIFIMRVEGF